MIKWITDRLGEANMAVLKAQIIPATLVLGLCLGIYTASQIIPPGIATFLISTVSLLIVLVTALARVNDLSIGLVGNIWHARRAGLIMVGSGAFGVWLSSFPIATNAPTWNQTMLHLGFALTWMTTPNMLPWWKWIAGKARFSDCVRCAQGEVV